MSIDLSAIKERCEKATPGPWHYYPCGEKSNDCVLGVAVGEDGSPPAGVVNLHPYNEEAREYEMDKYILDPSIAWSLDHANYADFNFMAHARTDVPLLISEIERLEKQAEDLCAHIDAKTGDTVQDSQWDDVWHLVHPNDSSWEYPGQVIREVRAEVDSLRFRLDSGIEEMNALAAENERLRSVLKRIAAFADEDQEDLDDLAINAISMATVALQKGGEG